MTKDQPCPVDRFTSFTAPTANPDFLPFHTHQFSLGLKPFAIADHQYTSSGAYPGTILVRDPPRDRLSSSATDLICRDTPLSTRCAGKSGTDQEIPPDPAHVWPLDKLKSYETENHHHSFKPDYFTVAKMTKKRRSLQSLFIHSFLPTSPSSSTQTSPTGSTFRMRSHSSVEASPYYYDSTTRSSKSQPASSLTSPRDSPPPSFFLDDDPFANLSGAQFESSERSATPTALRPLEVPPISTPRSPLTPALPENANFAQLASPPRSSGVMLPRDPMPRAFSSGRIQPRAAHQKPAFKSRPSLPSLSSLARMNVVITKKVRKGRVGAGLPYEPWDNLDTDRSSGDSISPLDVSSNVQVSSGSSAVSASSETIPPVPPISPSELSIPPQFYSTASPTVLSASDFTSSPSSLSTHSEPPLPMAAIISTSQDDTPPFTQTSVTSHVSSGHGNPVAELGLTFLDFQDSSKSNAGHYTLSPTQSSIFGDTSSQSEFPSMTDTDTSLDDFSSVPSLTRSTSLERLSTSLSRSLSLKSTSSSGSDLRIALDHSLAQSSESAESEILNSPMDDFSSFPEHSYSVGMVASWRNQFQFEDDLFEVSIPTHLSMISNESIGYTDKSPGEFPEPGTSAETIRAPMARSTLENHVGREMVDAGWSGSASGSQRTNSMSSQSGYGSYTRRGNGGSSGRGSLSGGWGGGHGGDDEDDGGERRINKSYISSPSSSESTSSDEDDHTDDYGEPSATAERAQFPVGSASSDDDDVPLAQRIPTALTAQRTIRKQVREEREQRRKDRAARAEARSRQTTLRPTDSGIPNHEALLSSSQEAALHASQPRQRTQTLPGGTNPFSADDLTRMLQKVQVAELPSTSSSHAQRAPSKSTRTSNEYTRSSKEYPEQRSIFRGIKDASSRERLPHPSSIAASASISHESPARNLRPMRSFHRPERRPVDEYRSIPMPADGVRGVTRARSRTNEDPKSSHGTTWLGRTINALGNEPVPQVPAISKEHRRLIKSEVKSTRASEDVERAAKRSQRPSVDIERSPKPNSDRPSISLVSAAEVPHGFSVPVVPVPLVQQRIFIVDRQSFNMVEVGPNTNAGDVLDMVEAQGSLIGWAGTGGWMLWEIAQDFGMERPIRNFELLSDIQGLWNKDKMVNAFLIKKTHLSVPLSRSTIPSSSPTYGGYVEWEVKRGKWSKRWMQLREHSLWLSKRDNGRDEVHLCSLSNFDAYFVTRSHKAPKPFVFSVKSTDNLSLFENTADYLHVFSCKEEDGNVWMEKILIARSYVLYQERQVLFNPKTTTSNTGAGSLSRSGTRKTAPLHRPFISVPAPHAASTQVHDVFEPGSLLSTLS